MNKKNLFIISGSIFCFIILFSLILFHILNSEEKDPRYVENPTTFEECKFKVWVDCGLIVDENMCYKIEGTNSSEWSHCQIVSNETKNCWVEGFDNCFIEFLNEEVEEDGLD